MSLWAEDVDLDQLRDLVLKYQDVNVALADGYITPDNHCVSAAGEGLPAELGAMGIHYIHPELLQVTATEPRVDGVGTHTDWMRPAILIYEPQADGSLTLVAVENLVFEKAWKEAGNAEVPVLNGLGSDGRRSADAGRRSARLRPSYGPACLVVSRQSGRSSHALQRHGHL